MHENMPKIVQYEEIKESGGRWDCRKMGIPSGFHHNRVLGCFWPIRGPYWEVYIGSLECARGCTRKCVES